MTNSVRGDINKILYEHRFAGNPHDAVTSVKEFGDREDEIRTTALTAIEKVIDREKDGKCSDCGVAKKYVNDLSALEGVQNAYITREEAYEKVRKIIDESDALSDMPYNRRLIKKLLRTAFNIKEDANG